MPDLTKICGASAAGLITSTVGPCVLRADHDGPLHQSATGVQWSLTKVELSERLRAAEAERDAARAAVKQWHDTYQQHANDDDAFLGELLDLLPGSRASGSDAYDQIPRGIKALRAERDALKAAIERVRALDDPYPCGSIFAIPHGDGEWRAVLPVADLRAALATPTPTKAAHGSPRAAVGTRERIARRRAELEAEGRLCRCGNPDNCSCNPTPTEETDEPEQCGYVRANWDGPYGMRDVCTAPAGHTTSRAAHWHGPWRTIPAALTRPTEETGDTP